MFGTASRPHQFKPNDFCSSVCEFNSYHLALLLPFSPVVAGSNENESVRAFRDQMIDRAHTIPGVANRQFAPRVMMWRDLSPTETFRVIETWTYPRWLANIRDI
jgi:hypothetical protein